MRIVTLIVMGLAGCATSPPTSSIPAAPASASPPTGSAPTVPAAPASASLSEMDLLIAKLSAAPAAGRSDQDDVVRAAVFRYQVTRSIIGARHNLFVCLEVSESHDAHDPSPAIMAAMASIQQTRVVPASACDATGNGVFLKADRAQGPGLVFYTEEIRMAGDEAIVMGGYYEGSLSASGNFYIVERQPDGSWLVTQVFRLWVS